MLLEGDLSVIGVIKEKKRILDQGESAQHINILCIVDGGLMKGAYAAGAGIALEELGYTNVFNTVVGISSGAPSAAYFVAGEVFKGSSLIYEECCSNVFIDPRHFWSPLNSEAVIAAMQSGTKQLSWDSIKASPVKLFIGIAQYENATPHLVEASDFGQLLQSIRASISIPTLSNYRVLIDGERFTDGGFTDPHILEHSLNSIKYTHALVFTSQDRSTADIPLLEKFLNKTLLRCRYSKALLKVVNSRRIRRHHFINSVLENNLPVCFVWGDNSIESTERNPEKVKSVVFEWRNKWKDLLS